MAQLQEFIGNHPFLVLGFVATLSIIIYTELGRRTRGFKEISPAEAVRLQNREDAVFIDVRDSADYRAGHIVGAKNIPTKEMQSHEKELGKLKNKLLIAYCTNGIQSAKACTQFKKDGFEQIHLLAGGTVAWEKASYPLEKKAGKK